MIKDENTATYNLKGPVMKFDTVLKLSRLSSPPNLKLTPANNFAER